MSTLFNAIGVLHVDHYAITTLNLISTLNDFLAIPNAKLLRGPNTNHAQQVTYAFVALNGMGTIEILAPLNENSPILSHIKNGGGAYHICYAVANLEHSITIAEQLGSKLIVPPRRDDAFDSRCVAFLIHPNHGVFELLEAYSTGTIIDKVHKTEQPTIISPQIIKNKTLLSIFNQVMNTEVNDIYAANMKQIIEWNSLKHLMLIMAIENNFEIIIDTNEIATLQSLEAIHNLLLKKGVNFNN